MTFLTDETGKNRSGFSLVEVLIVIAIIGIIAGIGVPTISSITNRSREATAVRHAQLVASMASNALHSGDFSLMEAGSKEAALALLGAGVSGTGSFENVDFRIKLSPDEAADALPYLTYKDGLLMINPTP